MDRPNTVRSTPEKPKVNRNFFDLLSVFFFFFGCVNTTSVSDVQKTLVFGFGVSNQPSSNVKTGLGEEIESEAGMIECRNLVKMTSIEGQRCGMNGGQA